MCLTAFFPGQLTWVSRHTRKVNHCGFYCSKRWWGTVIIFRHVSLSVPTTGIYATTHHHHSRFTTPFPGPPGWWAGARREFLDFTVRGKINRGRHNDHPAGCHCVWTNQCPPPPSPHFLQAGCPSCRPTNSVKALKATSAFGLGRRR